MQQSNFIFGMMLIAFIVFITVRGELPAYINLFRGQNPGGSIPSPVPGSSGVLGNTGNSVIDSAINNLPALPALAAPGGTAGDVLAVFGGE